MTVIDTVAVVEPPVLVAVIVYAVVGEIALGLPLSSPVDGFIVRPVGRAGEMLQVST